MDYLSLIRCPVEADLSRYMQFFEEALTHEDDFLGRALDYVKARRGKMMRPLLVLLIAKEKGAICDATLRSAVTLELLHTASLVHDDVVDESDERRGQASTKAVFGNKIAVLVGDYLLSEALHQSVLTNNLSCVDIIARLGGTLAEGEVFQLANIRNACSSEESYYSVIRRKTAELFASCARLGAITAGADEAFVAGARDFGLNVGMCFQIRDDIFDYDDGGNIGKPTGNDMLEGKLTLPVLYALQTTDNAAVHALADRVKSGEADRADISRLVEFTKQNGGIDYARQVMEDYRGKALRYLALFSNESIRHSLELYLDFVIGRKI